MVTTYSGIVPISGSLFEVTTTGIFPIVSFDLVPDHLPQFQMEANFHNEFTVIDPSTFFPGGSGTVVMFDVRSSVDEVQFESSSTSQATFINTKFDYSFAPLTSATGITVVTFAFDGNFSFVVPSVINRRVFPTDVPNATLFPGDRPRGSSLN